MKRIPIQTDAYWSRIYFVFGFAVIALLTLSLTSCNQAEPIVGENGLAKVTLALNWFPDSQHGGFYAAVEHGFYEEAGLDVEIVPGGPGEPVIQKLMLGRADFSICNADVILEANAQDANVVAVMAPMQNSPRCIMVHEESGIQSFADLNKPDVTLLTGSAKLYFKFLKSRVQLDKVRHNKYDGKINAFLQDKMTATQAYSFSEPFVAQQNDAKTRQLMVSKLGFNPYTSCITTNAKLIETQPEIVEKFVAASIRGWKKYIEDPTVANEKITSVNPRMDRESLEFGAKALKELCVPDESDESIIGQMNRQRWDELAKLMIELKVIPEEFSPNESFSLRFLSSAE